MHIVDNNENRDNVYYFVFEKPLTSAFDVPTSPAHLSCSEPRQLPPGWKMTITGSVWMGNGCWRTCIPSEIFVQRQNDRKRRTNLTCVRVDRRLLVAVLAVRRMDITTMMEVLYSHIWPCHGCLLWNLLPARRRDVPCNACISADSGEASGCAELVLGCRPKELIAELLQQRRFSCRPTSKHPVCRLNMDDTCLQPVQVCSRLLLLRVVRLV
eukprot:scpid89843/ scgid20570/ 